MVLKEYLMWLDMVAKDKQKLKALLERRTGKPLLELEGFGVSALLCEASVSAQELGLKSLSQSFWKRAEAIAPLSECIKTNWPLIRTDTTYENAHTPWAVFRAWAKAGVEHETGSKHSPAARWAEPRKYLLRPVE